MMRSSITRSLWREWRFMLRERAMRLWLWVALAASVIGVLAGSIEVTAQRTTIERLLTADRADRAAQLAQQSDWGSAAYYASHLTYDPPSALAFAALGERDTMPWKHRIRMLALEGQIHEADVANPELALVGRFDLAFVAAFLLPLLVIVALHDLRARERQAGRFELLMSLSDDRLWALRSGLRGMAIGVCVLLPGLVGGVLGGAPWAALGVLAAVVLLHAAFWSAVCVVAATAARSAAVVLTALIALWWSTAVLLPAVAGAAIERAVPLPAGGEIVLLQRETVNDGWDLPKETTMTAFVTAYPQWAGHTAVARPFEWKWYYAFQEIGDLRAAPLSETRRRGIAERHRLAGRWAWASPPALVERALQRVAGTDVDASQRYLGRVRDFHASLREFHYPKLFRDEPFEPGRLSDLPVYGPVRPR
jgi:ABC-2 type transport system permease protein